LHKIETTPRFYESTVLINETTLPFTESAPPFYFLLGTKHF